MKPTSIILAASLLLSGTCLTDAATIPEFVTVGYAGNTADANGFGAVGYEYSIGKYEVTNAEYAEFLNAVAKTDPYGLYDPQMGSSSVGGITRSGNPGSFVYTVKDGFAQRPVNFVAFVDAARYVNWLTNGGGSADTETGAYQISTTHSDMVRLAPAPGMELQYFISSEDEWYKAAYYDPTLNEGAGGYWLYPTQSNVLPTAGSPSGAGNRANYANAVRGLTDVGAYTNSSSYFGTYDQEGNVGEILDTVRSTGWVRRGSGYNNDRTGSGFRTFDADGTFAGTLGFRIVMVPSQIPEPSTVLLLGGGIFLGLLWRAKKASTGKASL